MFEYIDELKKLSAIKNKTNIQEKRLTELLVKEKIETDVMLHPEDFEV